jgi:hypothetical protein
METEVEPSNPGTGQQKINQIATRNHQPAGNHPSIVAGEATKVAPPIVSNQKKNRPSAFFCGIINADSDALGPGPPTANKQKSYRPGRHCKRGEKMHHQLVGYFYRTGTRSPAVD